jgi:two-component system response regulator AtoC
VSGLGYTPYSFENEAICLDNLSPLNPDLVISGLLSSEKTFRFVNALKMRNRRLPVLIISGDHTVQDFIDTNGFADVFVVKEPIEPSKIKREINRIKKNDLKIKMSRDCPLIIGNSPEMVKIKKMISELSRSKETVLVRGEIGTGKELVARAIHSWSDRSNNPFIKINAAALPCELFESELFGDNPGAFSGAHQNKKGMFEVANTGTIFLDEIGKIPASLQAKLLRVLERRNNSNPGSETKETVDIRIIAAADADLGLLVETKKFRKDLYYRLNVISIEIPPLRNRKEDIPLLAVFFNDKFCWEFGKSHYELSKKTKNMFSFYNWPGNVRELKNVVKSSVFLGDEESIVNKLYQNSPKYEFMDFIDNCEDIHTLAELSNLTKYLKNLSKVSLKDICSEFTVQTEKKLIKKALEKTNWNRKKAAILLDISYKSLLNKIKAYHLN